MGENGNDMREDPQSTENVNVNVHEHTSNSSDLNSLMIPNNGLLSNNQRIANYIGEQGVGEVRDGILASVQAAQVTDENHQGITRLVDVGCVSTGELTRLTSGHNVQFFRRDMESNIVPGLQVNTQRHGPDDLDNMNRDFQNAERSRREVDIRKL
uniref:Uncharacterized protein n=1 Tax=Rhabditophanes sp. KR3021 TaxID=114890 RepID=A0AC35U4X0_9BILA